MPNLDIEALQRRLRDPSLTLDERRVLLDQLQGEFAPPVVAATQRCPLASIMGFGQPPDSPAEDAAEGATLGGSAEP